LLALAAQGWIVRNKLVWAKPNPMPASVADRLTCSWEPIYFLVRSPATPLTSMRSVHRTDQPGRDLVGLGGEVRRRAPAVGGTARGQNDGLLRARTEGRAGHPLGKNPGDVWQIGTAGFKGAHSRSTPNASSSDRSS